MEHSDYYKEYLKSDAWRTKRKECYDFAGGFCEICREFFVIEHGQAHHLHYRTLGNESMTDLAWLCVPCHQKAHKKKYPQVFWDFPTRRKGPDG